MQSLSFFVLFFLSFLFSVQANIAFYFVNGFQTNATDLYYVIFTATTDQGVSTTTISNAIPFNGKYNLTVENCRQYVTNIKASLMSYPDNQAVASFYSDSKSKFYSNNFFIIAHTDSYDPVTGVNTPKLTAVSGRSDGPNIDSYLSVVTSYFFYSPQTNKGYFTAPSSFPVYLYPKETMVGNLYPNDDNNNLQYGESRTHSATSTDSLIYISSGVSDNTFTFCSNNLCASANSGVYAGSGQMFAAIYYGNAAFGQTGRIAFLTPPNTLSLN
eukprot:gene10280-11377_t